MSEKYRLQFDLSKQSLFEFDELKTEVGASTRAELFRNAIRFFAWYVSKRKNGYSILVQKDDVTREVEFPSL